MGGREGGREGVRERRGVENPESRGREGKRDEGGEGEGMKAKMEKVIRCLSQTRGGREGEEGKGGEEGGRETVRKCFKWSANPSNFMCLNWLSSVSEEDSFCTALECSLSTWIRFFSRTTTLWGEMGEEGRREGRRGERRGKGRRMGTSNFVRAANLRTAG